MEGSGVISGFDSNDHKELENYIEEVADVELTEVIDVQEIQSLMDDFHKLTHLPIGLNDINGNVLVSAGWQDICVKFHRIHPEACKHCVESDTKLTEGILPREIKLYKCKNNMWDIATPIMIGNKIIGYIFSGQFFFDDEPLDIELFRDQAQKYSFNEKEYIAALKKVPRLSRESVETGISFMKKFANLLSKLSYSNTKQVRLLSEQEVLMNALRESEKREQARSKELAAVLDAVPAAVWITHDTKALNMTGNRLFYEWLKLKKGLNVSQTALEGERPDSFKLFKDGVEIPLSDRPVKTAASGKEVHDYEFDIIYNDGKKRHLLGDAIPLRDNKGNPGGAVAAFIDITERKKIEVALRKSEAQLKEAQRLSKVGSWEWVIEDDKVTWSEELYKIAGVSPEEPAPSFKEHPNIYTRESWSLLEKAVGNALKTGEPYELVLEFIRVDGKHRWISAHGETVRDASGHVVGLRGTAQDITERKRAEEKLRQSEEKYRNIVETANEGISTINNEGIITYANQKLLDMLGYCAEEFINKPASDFVEDAAAFKGKLEDRRKGISESRELKVICKDGSKLWVNASVKSLHNEKGDYLGSLGMFTDISKRKLSDQALLESETRYRALAENSPDIITRFDRKYRHIYANSAAVKSYGISLDEIIGKTQGELGRDTKKVIAWEKHLENTFISGKSETMEFHITLNGKKHYFNTKMVPEFAFGKVFSVLAISRDITDIREAEFNLKVTLTNLDNLVKERTIELEKAYNLLKENEQLLAEAQRIAHIGSWEWNIEADKEYWSDEVYSIFGLDPREFELTHNAFLNFIHYQDRDYVNNAINEALSGKPYDIDYRIILADRKELVVNSHGGVIFDENHRPIKMRGIIQDITERKKAEEGIRNLANIVESSNDAIITKSLYSVIKSWNKGAEEIYGYTAEEIIGKPISILSPSHSNDEANKLAQMIKKGEKVEHYETIRLRKDGTLINVSLSLSPVFDIHGKLTAISVIARDITQRKIQEQERDMTMAFLQLVNASESICDLIHSVVSFFKEFYCFEAVGIRLKNDYDYPYFEASGFPEEFVRLENSLCALNDDGKPICDSAGYPIQECMCGNVINGRFDPLLPFFTKRGSFWTNCTTELLATTTETDCQARTRNRCNGEGYESIALIPLNMGEKRLGLIQLNDKRKGMFSLEMIKMFERLADYLVVALFKALTEEVLRETNERLQEQSKELELAYCSLKESERGLAEAQEMAHIGNWDRNLTTGEVYWSDEMHRIYCHNPLEPIPKLGEFFDHVHQDDLANVNDAIREAFNGKPISVDLKFVLNNGEERIVHVKGEVVFDEKKNPIRMKGTSQDITTRVKAEKALQKSEEQYRTLFNSMVEGFCIIELLFDDNETPIDYIFIEANPAFERQTGLFNVVGKRVRELIPSNEDYWFKIYGKVVLTGEPIRLDNYVEGLNSWYEVYAYRIGKPADRKVTIIFNDITERKKTEERLRESEEKYRNIVETANEGIVKTDEESIVSYVNHKMADMLGYTTDEIMGRTIWGFISDEYKHIIKMNLEKKKQGISESGELKLIRKDGSHIWTYMNSKPRFNNNGKYMGAVSMLTDITKRKEAEQALANTEIARKKEIHHRIKNNLQVISSLLDLQADKFRNKKNIRDSEVLEAFRESQDRVISMALIHEELYKGGGFEQLNFSPYVQELTENLLKSCRLGNRNIRLKLSLDTNVFFDMDIAVPLGMIINELVSNSFKHAFFGRDEGEIQIKLHREEIGSYFKSINEKSTGTCFVLTISDNGIGIPANLDIEALDSLGLQLVTSLVSQLDGELEIKRNNGTEFIIRFTVTEKNKHVSVPVSHQIDNKTLT